MKDKILYIITIIASIVILLLGYLITYQEKDATSEDMDTAKVVEVIGVEYGDYEFETAGDLIFKAKVTSGDDKGKTLIMSQSLEIVYGIEPNKVKVNDNIIVMEQEENNLESYIYVNHNKIPVIILLCFIFLGLILIIGRKKGISTILSLVFTCGAIFLIYIPGILKGFNIYLLTILTTNFIIAMSLLIINGYNKKTYCAIIGNVSGVLITGIIALIFNNLLNLTGILDSDYVYLTYINETNPIDLVALIWSGIIIGSCGAIMDIAMTISSSILELSTHMENKTFKKLYLSGMNIGKDAIGTMTNTLILAYIGGSIATVLLLTTYTKDTLHLFNLEMIVVEILQSVIGSIGILVAVPVTALFASYIFSRKNN